MATKNKSKPESDKLSGSSQMMNEPKPPFPKQHQAKPGLESKMQPKPRYQAPKYKAAKKLEGKVALITGGDSGIGRAVAVLFAREGANVTISYLQEEESDAQETREAVEGEGGKCLLVPGDLRDKGYPAELVDRTVKEYGKLDIVVSNAAYQNRKKGIEEITDEEWDRTWQINVSGCFRLMKAAMPHLQSGSAIIITSSITGLEGNPNLIDYSSTKGALNAFTKSLAKNLVDKGIRVNAVAPGPVWTPLNTADEGEDADKVAEFGMKTPLERPAQPEEIAPLYVFFASDADSSFMTGEVVTQLGGEVVSS